MKTNDTAPRITHVTVNTGDMQSVSLTESNFDPQVIAITRSMVTESVMDFRIVIVSEPGSKPIFDVLHGGSAVSRNTVRRDAEGNIDLTTLLLPASADFPLLEFQMLADLEQYAAIGLVETVP
jgi:hypothetical protein